MALIIRHGSSEVLAAAAHGFERFVTCVGGDADQVLGDVGLTPDDIVEPTRAISLSTYCGMLDRASARARNPNFGLSYGSQFEPQMLGLIGFIALASPTVGSALKNFMELFPLHQSGTETRLVRDHDVLRMEYRIVDPTIADRRHDAEFTIAAFANLARHALGADWSPVRVEFEHAAPADARDHNVMFDADVKFGKPTNALILREDRLDTPMPNGNLRLLDVLRASLVAVACRSPQPSDDLLERARAEIRTRLADGPISLGALADHLRVPMWTLQRRLSHKGLSYTELVEQVRRDLAMHYIQQPGTSLTETALLLGYSEASAFSRAFRQWFGAPPRSFRPQK